MHLVWQEFENLHHKFRNFKAKLESGAEIKNFHIKPNFPGLQNLRGKTASNLIITITQLVCIRDACGAKSAIERRASTRIN
jgi:hypothetical protein